MSILEKAIEYISPSWAAHRMEARATMAQVQGFMGTAGPGYKAGRRTRLEGLGTSVVKDENAVPAYQLQNIVADSWACYRDNPYARKIVSSLQSKVIGNGMQPESLVTRPDGSPNVEFRKRAKELWQHIQSGFDIRGLPGKGGQTMSGMQRVALRAVVLSGEVLYRILPTGITGPIDRGIPIPIALQLIDVSRLANTSDIPANKIVEGNHLYRGIELDPEGTRVAYWIYTATPGQSPSLTRNAVRIPAAEIGHLFIEDDIDQYRGTPWFASALIGLRDTGDLQYNVLKSSTMAACVVGSYSKPTGAARFGLNASTETQSGTADGSDLTDADGNAITKLQPAMMINTGKDGSFQLHSPNQPNMNPEGFIQHMLRGVGAGLPGIKSSTVTGDYRNSSFSSEKSADNDTWPEVESLQDWFATNFCQPIYEAVIKAGIESGYFDGIASVAAYRSRPHVYTQCKWQGPVGRSINPLDDADAAGRRVQLGISSLQMECAKVNVNWLDVLSHADELYQAAASRGLPPEVVNNILGIGANDVIAQTNKTAAKPVRDTSPRSLREEYALERMADAKSE